MAKQKAERWRPVPEFPEHYAVSDRGRVRRTKGGRGAKAGRILRATENNQTGYFAIGLSVNNRQHMRYVHRLVLEAFVGPCPPGLEGTHRNGKKNENRLSNLRWATHVENIADKRDHGTVLRGSDVGNSKLTEADVRAIRRSTELQRVVAARYGISRAHVSLIRSRKVWGHVEG